MRSLDDAIDQIQRTADGFDQEPNNVLWELIPRDNGLPVARDGGPEIPHDAFISHASEDNDSFVRPLANALEAAGLLVWFDEFSLTVGDKSPPVDRPRTRLLPLRNRRAEPALHDEGVATEGTRGTLRTRG